MERIDKIIGNQTEYSRKDVKKLVSQNRVKVNGEIISCDSMQIYKYMDIGTAKPTFEEREGIPHHLIDIVEPNEKFSVAEFKDRAEKCIEDILSRGKLPIIVGGTGLYVNALINTFDFMNTNENPEFRQSLEEELYLMEDYANAMGYLKKPYYYLFAKSGFSSSLKDMSNGLSIKLITLKDLYEI